MTLLNLTIIWAALLAVVMFLALARRWATRHEDDTLHLHEFDAAIVQKQSSFANRLTQVDRFGKSLTAVVVLYGIALIGRVVYLAWLDSLRIK